MNNLPCRTIIYTEPFTQSESCLREHIPTISSHNRSHILCSNFAMPMHRCERGLKKMWHVLLFFADFPLTFTTSTRFVILKNLNKRTPIDAELHFCAYWCYIVPIPISFVLTVCWSAPFEFLHSFCSQNIFTARKIIEIFFFLNKAKNAGRSHKNAGKNIK